MSSGPGIVFYDIPSQHARVTWSPNPAKTRYALDFKGLAYTTEWVEYPDIEGVVKALGGAPTGKKADGRPHYTLPMIRDLGTGQVVTDSLNIAIYLDKTYPDKPLMPGGDWALIPAFESAIQPLLSNQLPFGIPASQALLNPPSATYFRATREVMFAQTMEDMLPAPGSERETTQWAKVQAAWNTIDGWLTTAGTKYFGGAERNYADLYVAAYVFWIRTVFTEDKWRDFATWHGGRWALLLDTVEKD
ncbi:Glutathione transferase fungal specific class A [Mycena indigotica]|uniref:Glutathione transferase fungal specific class A n=1 Tax=Mycena indigotica TaxID=2126181 RepID=A0A8H6VWV4_9AGAR|nr:Glutathione transferase fungal specific class A [Mycena indigotica]KAF7296822.1 Glutathione transferase fungal specific class A [Mycena indigotica]